MFFACIASGHSYSGGVMCTASHLPFNRNGLKFFTSAGGALLRVAHQTHTHGTGTSAIHSLLLELNFELQFLKIETFSHTRRETPVLPLQHLMLYLRRRCARCLR